jgi:hypothetical protein
MSTVPKLPLFVREAAKALKALEHRDYSLTVPYPIPELGITTTIDLSPALLCETLVKGVLGSIRSSIVSVEKEPNGFNSFPDAHVVFSNGATQDAEVKSWWSDKREWSAAKISKFNKAILAGDPCYFTTPYIDFDLTYNKLQATIHVRKVTVGRIFDFSDARSLVSNRSGFRSTGSASPGIFMVNAARGDGKLLTAGAIMLASIGFIDQKEESVLLEEARRLLGK